MRDRSVRRLKRAAVAALGLAGLAGLVGAGALAGARGASAQRAPSAEVTLVPPENVTVGDRTAVIAEVRIDPPGDWPLLVTPTSEGTAIDVVRGRLLRADAEDARAEVLRFRIPLVAKRPGTAVIRVHVAGWACEERCRPAEADAEVVLRVERAAEPAN
jgi:hypothetical protein